MVNTVQMHSWLDTDLESTNRDENVRAYSPVAPNESDASDAPEAAETPKTPESPNGSTQSSRFIKEREAHKLEKRLCRLTGQAIVDYNMISEGDKVMVCVSGGKDSYAMLDILLKLRARAPIHFDIVAVNLDQKQPGFPADVLPRYLTELGVDFHIEN